MVYKYVWEDGSYYIGRSYHGAGRFDCPQRYDGQYVYKKMLKERYKAVECFVSDNIFKVYWLEQECINKDWYKLECLNGNKECGWFITAVTDWVRDNNEAFLADIEREMRECSKWIDKEGYEMVEKVMEVNYAGHI